MNQQIHDPQALSNDGINALAADIRRLAREISLELKADLQFLLAEFRGHVLARLNTAKDAAQLASATTWLGDSAPNALDHITQECRQRIDDQHGPAIAQLIASARQPLRERYQISQSLAAATPREMPLRMFSVGMGVSLAGAGTEMQARVKKFISRNKYLQHAAVGVATSAVRHPSALGLGIAVITGAAALAQGGKFGKLKEECIASIDEFLHEMQQEATSEAAIGEMAMEENIACGLVDVVHQDISEFQMWIEWVIGQERQTLANEQHLLSHLRYLRGKLAEHDGRLSELLSQATSICSGLSRADEGSRR